MIKNWLAIVGWYAALSICAFIAFAFDKWLAERGGRRVSERILHTLEALGGWPGALVAMRIVRHKSRKKSYLLVFWLIVLLHLAVWAAYLFWWRAEK